MLAHFRRLTIPVLLASLAGCAANGPFPSLAPRPIEQALANDTPAPPPPLIPSDPAVSARIEALERRARAGDRAFTPALATARAAVGNGGAAGSEGWVAAQLAVSRAQAERGETTAALGELNALAVSLAAATPPASQIDLARAVATLEEVKGIAGAQEAALAALTRRLSGR